MLPTVSGSLFYFDRHRRRYNVIDGNFHDNLNHGTLQGHIDISTPHYGNVIGFDLGLFATTDFRNSASPDHEMSFFPWRDPWSPDWSQTDARSGGSLYRAHLKLRRRIEDHTFWGKAGYFQPSGPGVLGVNWSLMPGTYRGTEIGMDSKLARGAFSLAAVWANAYKAPWYPGFYHFRHNRAGNERPRQVDYLWSLGARSQDNSGATAELAYGESQDFLQSAHIKLRYAPPDAPFSLAWHLYGLGDRTDDGSADDMFAGRHAWQHYLAASWTAQPYVVKAEFQYTHAPSTAPQHAGYFAYRLIGAYGGANGAYEPWWDNRSDWNHNRERAVFLSISRDLADLGWPGLSAGLSGAYGWGGKAHGVRETLRESAWSVDIGYAFPAQRLKGARVSLHYTHYDNKTLQPSWTGFKNLFQDERDIKILFILPWQVH
jgi:hypothetical protein